jgi:hypothetical protein
MIGGGQNMADLVDQDVSQQAWLERRLSLGDPLEAVVEDPDGRNVGAEWPGRRQGRS